MQCSCGGRLKPNHLLGIPGCLREKVLGKPRRVSGENDKWIVDGQVVTGTTLRQQRLYHQHPCGNWSRPRDMEPSNSLPDEA